MRYGDVHATKTYEICKKGKEKMSYHGSVFLSKTEKPVTSNKPSSYPLMFSGHNRRQIFSFKKKKKNECLITTQTIYFMHVSVRLYTF